VVMSQGVKELETQVYPIRRVARTATPVDVGLSYQPGLICDALFRGWQCEYDSATIARFCPIRLETLSPDASAARIVSSSGDVFLLR
jgi:hypothetical protein